MNPKCNLSNNLVAAINDYHEWHGDTNVKIVGKIGENPYNSEFILTRATDAQGNKISCALTYYTNSKRDHGYNVSEFESSVREKEGLLIEEMLSYIADRDGSVVMFDE